MRISSMLVLDSSHWLHPLNIKAQFLIGRTLYKNSDILNSGNKLCHTTGPCWTLKTCLYIDLTDVETERP